MKSRGLDESADGGTEEGLGAIHETGSLAAEEPGTQLEKVPEHEGEEKERPQRNKSHQSLAEMSMDIVLLI